MAVEFLVDNINAACLDSGFQVAIQSLTVPLEFFVWAKPNTINVGTGQALIVKNRALAQGFTDTQHFTFEMQNSAGLLANQIAPITSGTGATAGVMVANVWQACGCSFIDNSDRTADYNGVNGALDNSAASNPDCGTFTIGGRIISAGPTIFRPFHGCLAKAAAWNVVLSGANKAELATGVDPPNIAGGSLRGNLLFYLPMVDVATAGKNLAGTFGDFTAFGSMGTCSDNPPVPPSGTGGDARAFFLGM